MLRVYLDQNHWISLLKARTGHPGGDRVQDTFVLLQEAVARGWVSLPLSMRHCMEVQHRANFDSRLELAATMVQLSRWHAIAPPSNLVAAEIDHALQARFRRPAAPRTTQVFGVGVNHAFGKPIANYEPPADANLTAEQRTLLKRRGSSIMEAAVLVGAPAGLEMPGYDPTAHRRVGERFAAEQEQLRDTRRPDGYHRGDRGRRATSVDVFAEFERSFSEALDLAGLHWGHLYSLEQEGLEALLRDIPTVFAHRELRRLRHEASPKPWEESDLNDLAALGPALVYCDVVVTERVWTDLAHRAGLGERFGTSVFRDLADLMPLVIASAA